MWEAGMSSGSLRRRQAVAAGASVVVGAVVNVATGMLTQRWGMAWLAATVAFVVVGGVLLAWLTARGAADPEPSGAMRVSVSGDGAIAAGGSVIGSSTRVTRRPMAPPARPETGTGAGEGVNASGSGSIAAGGDVRSSRTEVTGEDSAS
jgi:hypothetical protein